jgi:hypothetical protein
MMSTPSCLNTHALIMAAQMLLISVLPVAVASQLLPRRFQALALSHPHIVVNSAKPASTSQPAAAWQLALPALPLMLQLAVREVRLLLRAAYLGLIFSPALLLAPLAMWAGGNVRAAWMQVICWCLERAGPAFIKWGQVCHWSCITGQLT